MLDKLEAIQDRYYYLEEKPENPVARGLYVIEVLFFAMFWVISLGN